jgi:hypothetical protein
MNEEILKVLIKNRGIDLDGSWLMNAEYNDLQVLANKIEEAINYTHCCKELRDDEDPNYKFNKKDFKYSEFIKGVGKEYNYVSNKVMYFINGTLTKILNP